MQAKQATKQRDQCTLSHMSQSPISSQADERKSPIHGKGREDAKFWSNLPEIADVLDTGKMASANAEGDFYETRRLTESSQDSLTHKLQKTKSVKQKRME
jgi:hypothetical protein